MCGRYSLTTPTEALRQLFKFGGLPNLAARYNIAPTQDAPVVRTGTMDGGGAGVGGSGERTLDHLRWGLIPSWAKEPSIGARMINARAETVAKKPSFRAAFAARRCLIPADGFYEWRTEGGKKQPYRVTLADGAPFAFAGLWESWPGAKGGDGLGVEGPLESFTIITTEANERLRPIHARMPFILEPGDFAAWLGAGSAEALSLLKPSVDEAVTVFPVSTIVNNARNDDPACILPLDPGPADDSGR